MAIEVLDQPKGKSGDSALISVFEEENRFVYRNSNEKYVGRLELLKAFGVVCSRWFTVCPAAGKELDSQFFSRFLAAFGIGSDGMAHANKKLCHETG